MNIVGARITTSRGGIALDSFRVGHLDQREMVLEPERWERVQHMLARVLRYAIERTRAQQAQARYQDQTALTTIANRS